MSKHKGLIHQFSNATFRCGEMSGDDVSIEEYRVPYNESEDLEKQLLERDRKLVDALKYISEFENGHYAVYAAGVLKDIGEE